MRLALAHLLALVVYICALYGCFAFLLGISGDLRSGFRFESQVFGFAIIYMMFIGPFALVLMLVYFAVLRARILAIVILLVSSLSLGLAFSSYTGFMGLLDFLEQRDLPFLKGGVALLKHWMSKGEGQLGIGIIWAGVTAALAHHLVYAALKPRVIKESVSHA